MTHDGFENETMHWATDATHVIIASARCKWVTCKSQRGYAMWQDFRFDSDGLVMGIATDDLLYW